MVAFPFNSSESFDDRWRKLHDHEAYGVVGDTDGLSCKVTATGASTTVSVQPGRYKLFGFELDQPTPVAFNLGALGSQPQAGQTRIDRIVVRLTSTTLTFEALIGTPATSGAQPVAPAQPDPGGTGTYEVVIGVVTRNGGNAISQGNVLDWRTWKGDTLYAAPGYLLGPHPLGTRVHRGSELYERVLSGTTPVWQTRASQSPVLAIRKTGTTNLIPTAGVWTAIAWDTNVVREGDTSMHSTTVGPPNIFLNVAGWWDVTFTFTPDIPNTGGLLATSVMHFDSGANPKVRYRGAAFTRVAGEQSTYVTHATVLAVAGDLVQAHVWSSVPNIFGIGDAANANTRIAVHRIG